jgi:hypothetical protein
MSTAASIRLPDGVVCSLDPLQDIDLAAANLGFKLANAKDMFPPMSDGAAEMLLTETKRPLY